MPLLSGASQFVGCTRLAHPHSRLAAVLPAGPASSQPLPNLAHGSSFHALRKLNALRPLPLPCCSLPSSSGGDADISRGDVSASRRCVFESNLRLVQSHLRSMMEQLRQASLWFQRIVGSVALILMAMIIGSGPAHAAESRVVEPPAASTSSSSYGEESIARKPSQMGVASSVCSGSSHYTGIDLAEAGGASATALAPASTAKAADLMARGYVPIGFDEVMGSQVYNPHDVPFRAHRSDLAEQIHAIMEQYDKTDFNLGIKQFLIEQAIQQSLEDDIDKNGGNEDYEQKLAEALFADDQKVPKALVTEDIAEDAFTTEAAEEYFTLFGEVAGLKTAWRVQQTGRELSYTQFWTLVGEGNIDQVKFFGPEKKAMMVTTRASAPGGVRTMKVVPPPDPLLHDYMVANGVVVDPGTDYNYGQAFTIQMIRYTLPFMFIGAVFWLLHTWLLDPLPSALRRDEFLRFRRELMHIASQLNLRSPARQVRIKTDGPDFIPWDEIHGIDSVKKEIIEIIDYLKNPELLRLRGVAKIGGVMLAGAPGTGKTLLAKSIAAESGVKMFTCSGTDFFDIYNGVGARRIRETFDKMRNNAPAILFIDEFDALGAARGKQAGGDEAGAIINELIMQMDNDDNAGLVVLGATNRPGAIDSALVREGRFDRIIYMPLPDADGRAKILQVHARNKAVDPSINWYMLSRTMAGFTGADCMGLMQRAARMAAREGRDMIVDEDIYSAMENKALESGFETKEPEPGQKDGLPEVIPTNLRKAIATYEAGKALLAHITPEAPEVARVSVCPFDLATGYVLFNEDESPTAGSNNLTRAKMETYIVMHLAGRCAEKLVMGESELTALGAPDLWKANMIAREMILSMGMGRRTGPIDLMSVVPNKNDSGLLLRTSESATEQGYYYHANQMSLEQSRLAMAEVLEILEAAESKAFYGLAINWKPLQALVEALLEKGVLQRDEIVQIFDKSGVIYFPDNFLDGFGWEEDGSIKYPFKPKRDESLAKSSTGGTGVAPTAPEDKTWLPVGDFGPGGVPWHWNMPYTMKTDLPDWYQKEMDRYTY